MEEEHFEPFFTCPICGADLENVFKDDSNGLIYKSEEGIDDIFLTDDGVFRFVPDEEHPELLHIDWHHQH